MIARLLARLNARLRRANRRLAEHAGEAAPRLQGSLDELERQQAALRRNLPFDHEQGRR